MEDRVIMENILSTVKGACDLMMHGTIEAATPDVQSTFKMSLNDALTMQADIYKKMSQMGWYPSQQAEQQQIQQVKQKYSNN